MPDWSKSVAERIAALSLDPAREAAIVEEIAQHANDRYEELLARGEGPEEAHRAVLAELDGGDLLSGLRSALPSWRPAPELGQDERGSIFASLVRDLRHGIRLLRLDPAFAAVAILSLALGIGANTAIFQLLDAVRLRPLPVERPDELADARVTDNPFGRTGNFSSRHPQLTYPIWERLREGQQAFSSVGAWSSGRLNASPGGEARPVEVLWVGGAFFETLGVRPALGRLISASDDRRGCTSAGAVLSDSFWRREYGGRASALEGKITLNRHPFPIMGVTQPGFFGVEVGLDFDVAIPLCADAAVAAEASRLDRPDEWWLAVIGRRKPGWSIERTSAHLAALSPGTFTATLPPGYDAVDAKHYLAFKLGSRSLSSGVSDLRESYGNPLVLLLGISGLVLLIACANLANLLVARASARRREVAVRLALGASRARLVRQLLAESLLLASLGAACGAALAQAASRILVAFLSTQDARLFVALPLDLRTFGFATILAAATCLVFGLAPALQATRAAPIEAMKSGGRGIAGSPTRLVARRALVIAQVSLSLVLLVGALLFARTLRNLTTLDAGFRRDQILVVHADLTPLGLPPKARVAYKQELLSRVRTVPGAPSAAMVRIVPASGEGWNENITIEGTAVARKVANFNRVSPGYFAAMGTPLLAGRDFADRDTASALPVAVVTEAFSRKFLAGASSVGRTLIVARQGGSTDRRYEIVGLVKDTKYGDLREEFTPIVFLPAAQEEESESDLHLVIRTDGSLSSLTAAVKRGVADVSPQIVLNFQSFESILRDGLLRERLMATLAGFFGLLAAALAMIGLYGVVSYMVVRRRNEIGVRMAMGANRRDILVMILREAGTLLAVGLAIGTILSLVAATSARALLFGLKPSDPLTLAIAVASLTAIAAIASLLPAQRAAKLDPMAALRED